MIENYHSSIIPMVAALSEPAHGSEFSAAPPTTSKMTENSNRDVSMVAATLTAAALGPNEYSPEYTVSIYREILRKLQNNGGVDEPKAV